MSQRQIRVSELIMREISAFIHARWRTESQRITITGVDISADLQKCRVYYSVLGGREEIAECGKFLMKERNEIRKKIGREIVLKFTPELHFIYDPSVERGMHVIELLDEIAEDTPPPENNDKKTDAEREQEKAAWKAKKASKKAEKAEPRRNDWKKLADGDGPVE